ncbi:histidine phosphatase family protein [Sulfitobacter aestuarii]|uniref:Histidine phosphatase family protein n=1 Tax=Sulfitobacter aestuarii TaxID=2161676 RepID=A0ABW5U6A7_9RHOB
MKDHPPLWFLRHGQTQWNAEHRLQGQLDSPLTAQGRRDAARQAALLPPILAQKPAIFVSPLGRARQTAEIALQGAAYRTDPRLMEIHAGAWQGLTRSAIVRDHPHLQGDAVSPLDIYAAAEAGEGISVFRARIADFLDHLQGPSVVIAHGLLGQVLRAELRGIDLAEAGRLCNRQGCIYHLERGRETLMEAA